MKTSDSVNEGRVAVGSRTFRAEKRRSGEAQKRRRPSPRVLPEVRKVAKAESGVGVARW